MWTYSIQTATLTLFLWYTAHRTIKRWST